MKKRLLSLLLVLAMVLSMVPAVSAANETPFTDVPSNKWYADEVSYVYEHGFMNGLSDTSFSPTGTMTRGMFVTVLGRMVGVNAESYSFRYFNDVELGRYFSGYVNWAASNGIVNGYPGGTFKPDQNITRQEMATIISRYITMAQLALNEDPSAPASFSDAATISNFAKNHVEVLRKIGIMNGSSGAFNPKATANRAEGATVFMRLNELIIASNATQTYQVSFMYNYDGKGSFATYDVTGGEPVSYPSTPVRAGYSFAGWYVDAECTQLYDFTGIITCNTVLYAGWSQGGTSDEISSSYEGGDTLDSINDVTVDGGYVTVNVNATQRYVLAVTFYDYTYDETTQEMTMGSSCATAGARVSAGSEMQDVTARIVGTLPEYYMVKVQLMNSTSEAAFTYISRKYTEQHAIAEARTVADFPEEEGYTVVNFDESEDENFGVLADNVQVLDAEAIAVDDSYTFHTESGLVEGDVIMVNVDGEETLIKVDDLTTNSDGSVTVTADDDTEMTDFYQYINVDTEVVITGDMVDMATADDGVTLVEGDTTQSIEDVHEEDTVSAKLNFKIAEFEVEDVTVSGEVTGTVKAKIKIIYDLVLFGEDYLEFEFKTSYDVTFNAKWVISVGSEEEELNTSKYKKNIKLGKVNIPFGVSGLSAFTDLKVAFDWKLEGGMVFEAKYEVESGFKYDTENGRRDIDKKKSDFNLNLEGSVEMTLGPKPAAGIEFLGGVVKAEVNVFMGAKVTGKAVVPIVDGGDTIHGCYLCIDGKVSAVIEANVELKYHITDDFSGTPVKVTILEYEKLLLQFYVSLANEYDSQFQGHVKFGLGECPNQKYKTIVKAQDTLGNDVSVNVLVSGEDGLGRGNFTSGGHIYLYDGVYTASAHIDGISVSRTFTISEEGQTVILSPQHQDGILSGKITDAEDGSIISGATITASQNGVVSKTTSSDGSGEFEMELAEGTYDVKISATGYQAYTTTISVYPNDTRYLETSLMVKEEENMGGVAGYITDAVTGRGISGVSLEIYNGWGNILGTPVATLTTNSSGYYEYETWTVFGVIWGLPIGNYTIKATHPDYNDTSFNVVVLGDTTLGNQNTTMNPLNVEQDYRVVLTWGSTPRDLDSHYNAKTESGSYDHVYYSRKRGTSANLDVDDVSGYGPETITVTDFDLLEGGFAYSVHDYTNRNRSSSTALSSSGATVKLYLGDELLRTYSVPTGRTGTVWNVFSIDEYGRITSLNSFDSISSPGSVGADLVGDSLYAEGVEVPYALKDYELE